MRFLQIFILSLLFLGGCKQAAEKVKEDFKPQARGEADEIILVMDSAQWKGQVGDEMRAIYQQYMKILNQDEFEFSINKVNPHKLNNVFKNSKNLIFVMSLDSKSRDSKEIREFFTDQSLKMIQNDTSLYYTVRMDEFAHGQMVLYLFSKTEEQLVKKIHENQEGLRQIFAEKVKERVRNGLLSNPQKDLTKQITANHGFEIQVPFGWDLAKDLKDFIWLRRLEADKEYDVFVYEGPFDDPLFYEKVDEIRDKITSVYLTDMQKPDIHIARQTVVPTYSHQVNFNGKFAVESRGLWRVSDNSAGGPYVGYIFVDEPNQKLYYIEGYIYAPGGKKKRLIREVDAVLSTFKTPSELGKDPS